MNDIYLNDAAFQYYLVKGTGFPIEKVFVVYINNQFLRNGAIDPFQLFLVEEVTGQVREKQDWIKEEIKRLRLMLGRKEPEITIGIQCDDPYPYDFQGHCWATVPDMTSGVEERGSLYSTTRAIRV